MEEVDTDSEFFTRRKERHWAEMFNVLLNETIKSNKNIIMRLLFLGMSKFLYDSILRQK